MDIDDRGHHFGVGSRASPSRYGARYFATILLGGDQVGMSVISELNQCPRTVHELADAINERKLYEKRDRSPVEPSQIDARANKYPGRFEKDGPRVRGIAAQTQT